MLTFKREEGFIHADLKEETAIFSLETIAIEGNWYHVGDITEDEEGKQSLKLANRYTS